MEYIKKEIKREENFKQKAKTKILTKECPFNIAITDDEQPYYSSKNNINGNKKKKSLKDFKRNMNLLGYGKLIFFIISNLIIISSKFDINKIKFQFSSIKLKLNNYGDVTIFYPGYYRQYYYTYYYDYFGTNKFTIPDSIIINGVNRTTITHTYYFSGEYVVELIWNNKINNTASLFAFCEKIIEISIIQKLKN